MTFVLLSNYIIVILFIVGIVLLLLPKIIKYRKLGLVLYALSFLCLIGLITYGLLLSPKLDELLIIVLIYAFISLFSFYPENSVKDNEKEEIEK
jgi:hypothetical protein